jgi:FkbM family methyltransferase
MNIKEIIIRVNSTDAKAYSDVFDKKTYMKHSLLKSGDIWLDLGAHIGCFTIQAKNLGVIVHSYEAEQNNKDQFFKNLGYYPNDGISIDGGTLDLYKCKDINNTWRHSLLKVRGREIVSINTLKLDDEIYNKKPDGIKIDIEGYELNIIDYLTLDKLKMFNVKYLIIEYSFDKDKKISNFIERINKLKLYYKNVIYDSKVNINLDEYNFFPQQCMIYCY